MRTARRRNGAGVVVGAAAAIPRAMLSFALRTMLLGLFVVALPRAAAAQELANDGWVGGSSTASFQGGFAAGEMIASRFVPAGAVEMSAVLVLFGGADGTATVRVHVWDDTTGPGPGAERYVGDFELSRSDDSLQVLDVSAANIVVAAPFRVGIELLTGGLPSVARDDDGTVTATENFILVTGSGWLQSGLTGDWVLRARVTPVPDAGSDLDAAVGLDAGRLDAGAAVDAAGPVMDASGPECTASSECALDRYCSSAGVCARDCRTTTECRGGSSCVRGECIASGPPTTSSCACRARGRGAPSLLLAAAMLAFGVVRARSRRRAGGSDVTRSFEASVGPARERTPAPRG